MIKQGDTYIPEFNDRLVVKTVQGITALRGGEPTTPKLGLVLSFQVATDLDYFLVDREGQGWQISAAAFAPLDQQPYVVVNEVDD